VHAAPNPLSLAASVCGVSQHSIPTTKAKPERFDGLAPDALNQTAQFRVGDDLDDSILHGNPLLSCQEPAC
jgi:hypothetical protein